MSQVYLPLAALSGGLLALMIFINGELARLTSSSFASTVAHLIGAITAWVIWLLINRGSATRLIPISSQAPKWSYLGGFAGAVIVILASITVNSELGLAGSLSIMLVGQVLFSLLVDTFGWFGMRKRELNILDFGHVLFVLTGTSLLIFFAR
jgi:transporter family-2 protein